MTNAEFKTGFDILYNNITSNQAPGLNEEEMSFFLNKAQLEVLKNHLNPKGNKYGEGYDDTSKRQIDFSTLTVEKSYYLYPKRERGKFIDKGVSASTVIIEETEEAGTDLENDEVVIKKTGKKVPVYIDRSNILAILNEGVEVYVGYTAEQYLFQVDLQVFGLAAANDFNGDGKVNIEDVTTLIDYIMEYHIFEGDSDAVEAAVDTLIAVLIDGKPRTITLSNPVPIEEIYKRFDTPGTYLTVVPITATEYDTLVCRPYKYPVRSQAWRMFVNGGVDINVGPNEVPVKYCIRYVRLPKEFDLSKSDEEPELPKMLHDEVLQRAVELAKLSWEGNLNAVVAAGQNSE